MRGYCNCGSYAINPHLHGRDETDKDLCDVCYWRKRAGDAYRQGMIRAAEVAANYPAEGRENGTLIYDRDGYRIRVADAIRAEMEK